MFAAAGWLHAAQSRGPLQRTSRYTPDFLKACVLNGVPSAHWIGAQAVQKGSTDGLNRRGAGDNGECMPRVDDVMASFTQIYGV